MENEAKELGKSWKLVVSRKLTFSHFAFALVHPSVVKADSEFSSLVGVCVHACMFLTNWELNCRKECEQKKMVQVVVLKGPGGNSVFPSTPLLILFCSHWVLGKLRRCVRIMLSTHPLSLTFSNPLSHSVFCLGGKDLLKTLKVYDPQLRSRGNKSCRKRQRCSRRQYYFGIKEAQMMIDSGEKEKIANEKNSI